MFGWVSEFIPAWGGAGGLVGSVCDGTQFCLVVWSMGE